MLCCVDVQSERQQGVVCPTGAMTKRSVWLTVAIVVLGGSPLLCVVGAAVAFVGAAATCGASVPKPANDNAMWDVDQRANAATIMSVGRGLQVPTRAIAVALAAAMTESGLRNNPGGDRDSAGLFQMRPSMGWGSHAEVTNVYFASNKFYDVLLRVPDWQTKRIGDAAQAVERSAFPTRYYDAEPKAIALLQEAGLSLDQASTNQCIGDSAVFARAATWLTAWQGGPVPYLSSTDPADWLNGYRRDCSGYVSMALGLPGPGLDTGGLAARSMPISQFQLKAGDLLINPASGPAGHVVLFERWTDSSMTRYVGYEQSGDAGTHHREIPYPYFPGYSMSPYRWLK